MKFGRKPDRPVDRALADLEHQIAAMEQEIRRCELQQPAAVPPRASPAPAPRGVGERRRPASTAETAADFARWMFTPGGAAVPPPARTRRDLFDIPTDPLKELEDAPRPAPHLGVVAPAGAGGELTDGGAVPVRQRQSFGPVRSGAADARLINLLQVGSLRTNKPLKHVQRKERHRFWTWIGLAFGVLWILYVLVW